MVGECQNPFCLKSNCLPVVIVTLKPFFGNGQGDAHCAEGCEYGPIDLRIVYNIINNLTFKDKL